jgi:hypothetical protein
MLPRKTNLFDTGLRTDTKGFKTGARLSDRAFLWGQRRKIEAVSRRCQPPTGTMIRY